MANENGKGLLYSVALQDNCGAYIGIYFFTNEKDIEGAAVVAKLQIAQGRRILEVSRVKVPEGEQIAGRQTEAPCACGGKGWLHMADSMGAGPGIERCDDCGRYPDDDAARLAHDRECNRDCPVAREAA